jgi:antitoxin YefM
MALQTTYTNARANLASLLDRVTENNEPVVITRRGAADVALIPADELRGLLETAHLLRSPANAERLLRALNRALKTTGKSQAVESLRRELGLEDEL